MSFSCISESIISLLLLYDKTTNLFSPLIFKRVLISDSTNSGSCENLIIYLDILVRGSDGLKPSANDLN